MMDELGEKGRKLAKVVVENLAKIVEQGIGAVNPDISGGIAYILLGLYLLRTRGLSQEKVPDMLDYLATMETESHVEIAGMVRRLVEKYLVKERAEKTAGTN